jgi:uncharacterized protein (TIGR02145 family)
MKRWIINFSPGVKYFGIIILILFINIFSGCSQDDSGPEPEPMPIVSTNDISIITATTAICNGTIESDEGIYDISFGVCWSRNQTPTVSDDNVTTGYIQLDEFISPITGLIPNTKYYVRTFAEGNNTISYGDIVSFTTLAYTDSVIDFDSNVYYAVTIGTQVWTVENLRVTHYRNGDPIANITEDSQWHNSTEGAYCNYNNDPDFIEKYGRLYNWYAVKDAHNITPEGWHVPTSGEWQILIDYLGGEEIAGIKMREPGVQHWEYIMSNQPLSTNESGFLALPGGERINYGNYYGHKGYTAYWSTTSYNNDNAWRCLLNWSSSALNSQSSKSAGLSIRLVKD